jgi:multidrug efflux pump subunit AcrA (membrane-fusion protein)
MPKAVLKAPWWIAGHFAGHHGVLGAAAGCAIGHHEANKPKNTQPTTTAAPRRPRLSERTSGAARRGAAEHAMLSPMPQKEVQRNLVLPAVVEADPARLVKVLPPLAGRITQLKVQLGEEVEKSQPLFVLDSPDLDTAYADYERAKGTRHWQPRAATGCVNS